MPMKETAKAVVIANASVAFVERGMENAFGADDPKKSSSGKGASNVEDADNVV